MGTSSLESENTSIPRGLLFAVILLLSSAIYLLSSISKVDFSLLSPAAAPLSLSPAPRRVICVTPTYVRATQALHLVRITTVLRVMPPPLLWIVVEMHNKTKETSALLERLAGRCMRVGAAKECTKIDYVHLVAERKLSNVSKGMGQRNAALRYIEERRIEGLVYFMDDDNAYDPMIFEELRKTERVGILPVAFLWNADHISRRPGWQLDPLVERALVGPTKDGKGGKEVIGWETSEWSLSKPRNEMRKYAIDMAGFVFDSVILWTPTDPKTNRPVHPIRLLGKPGYLEPDFLNRIVGGAGELEPLADECRDVYVWHVNFETDNARAYPRTWRLPQPGPDLLVADPDPAPGISRYVNLSGQRMKIKNYNSTVPFGYNEGVG